MICMVVAHALVVLLAQRVTQVLTGSRMVLVPANVKIDSGTINLGKHVRLVQRVV